MLLNCGVGEDSWESLGLQGDPTGWDGWMAPPTRWTWVWVDSWSWWWTGRPGVLRFMGSQRVGHDWVTELNWTEHISRVEAPILWSPEVKSWLIGKDLDAGKDWGQEEKGAAQNEMVGWHHRLNGRECEPIPGDSEGQGSLACCSLQGHKNWIQLNNWATANYPEERIKRWFMVPAFLQYLWWQPTSPRALVLEEGFCWYSFLSYDLVLLVSADWTKRKYKDIK